MPKIDTVVGQLFDALILRHIFGPLTPPWLKTSPKDTTSSPCSDFAQFACGNYESNFEGKAYLSSWGVVESLQEDVYETVRQIMEEGEWEGCTDEFVPAEFIIPLIAHGLFCKGYHELMFSAN